MRHKHAIEALLLALLTLLLTAGDESQWVRIVGVLGFSGWLLAFVNRLDAE